MLRLTFHTLFLVKANKIQVVRANNKHHQVTGVGGRLWSKSVEISCYAFTAKVILPSSNLYVIYEKTSC